MTVTTLPRRLTHDLHVHLHGCLTPEDLWELGKGVWRERRDRLDWYATHYEAATRRRPDYAAYWQADDGATRLARDVLFDGGGNFAAFQARFNLIIALLPITPKDESILRLVMERDAARGVEHIEYRCYLPPHFDAATTVTYLNTLTRVVATADLPARFVPRIALTIEREPARATAQYGWIKDWQRAAGAMARYVTAIDFAGYEAGDDPANKAALFERVRADNRQDPPRALAVLCHVGESFERHAVAAAAELVANAAEAGVHRLGHAVALGLATNDAKTELIQDELIERVAATDAVIECCPTSNCRIAPMSDPAQHPLRRFLDAGLPVVIGTDDPGLLATSLESEAALCTELLGISGDDLTTMNARAGGAARSAALAGRPEDWA
jgi:adenosine deaminase